MMARLAAAKGWFLSSGESKGSLSSGHTCIEQSNNYNDRVCSERGQHPFSGTGDPRVPGKG